MNLNNLAGRVLAAAGVHSYEPILWYRCLGQENTGGKIRPVYAEGVPLQVQTRTASPEETFSDSRPAAPPLTQTTDAKFVT